MMLGRHRTEVLCAVTHGGEAGAGELGEDEEGGPKWKGEVPADLGSYALATGCPAGYGGTLRVCTEVGYGARLRVWYSGGTRAVVKFGVDEGLWAELQVPPYLSSSYSRPIPAPVLPYTTYDDAPCTATGYTLTIMLRLP
eukprot:3490962-Rhodomonas_salina.3